MRKYAILRNLAVGGSPFESTGPSVATEAVPEPQVEVSTLDTRDVVDLAKDPNVQSIAPVMPTAPLKPVEVAASAAANDAWGIAAVKAEASSCTGDGVTVAVLDTGIDRTHPAFTGVDIIEQDFSGSGNGDRQGHGSHCAGTILGRDVDGARIGIAQGVKRALIGKVLADNGGGDSYMIFRGIQWAVDQGANLISIS